MESFINEIVEKAKKNNSTIMMNDLLEKADKFNLSDEQLKNLLLELDNLNIEIKSEDEIISNALELKTDAIGSFLRESRRFPLLTKEEEIELSHKVQEGDKKAFEKMCNSNLRLVFSIAKRYVVGQHALELEDLLQEGCQGLMKAIKIYNPDKGYKFSTYATWWIRQAITRFIANNSRTIRIPVHVSEKSTKYKKLCAQYKEKYDRNITDEEACIILKISKETLNKIKLFTVDNVHLDEPLDKEDNTETLKDTISDTSEIAQVQDCVDNSELRENLEYLIDKYLDCREEIVIKKRFGIGYPRVYTLEEIAQDYNLTRERIRQIQNKALKKLKTSNCMKLLGSYMN